MRTISIKVAGNTFQIRSDANDEYVEKLAGEISERFVSIKPKGPRADHDFRAMTMVAISLLDELTTTKQKYSSLKEKARKFASQMIDRIENLLSSGPS